MLFLDHCDITMFYKSTVESIISFCMSLWYGSCTGIKKRKISKVIKTAKKLGCDITDATSLYNDSLHRKLKGILKDVDHPLNCYVTYLPSGKRLRALYARTTRLKNSFLPSAVRLFNDNILPRT